MTSKDDLFDTAKLSPRDKAAAIDTTARAIITAEAEAGEKKTEKLRALHLQQEAEAPTAAPAKKRRTAPKSASSS
ncbi:hypothetical protein [Rhizobium sp. YTU87027]|uniref:hypothetical protein n=1 Tax=Rhizobium sp. YTU87027 TaxID=3417741 RepID=UPI003D694446